MTVKIVIVDDHPTVCRGLSCVLCSDPAFEVVGEAGSVEQSLQVIAECRPDLVLVDLRLGADSGLEVIKQAKAAEQACKFVVLTSSTAERDFFQAEQLGVNGYLLKEALPEEIIYALKLVSQDRKYYDPGILDLWLKGPEPDQPDLTAREKEVLCALGKGLSNREISQCLFVTENTVKKHVSQILSKLNLADRTQAALYAVEKGFV